MLQDPGNLLTGQLFQRPAKAGPVNFSSTSQAEIPRFRLFLLFELITNVAFGPWVTT